MINKHLNHIIALVLVHSLVANPSLAAFHTWLSAPLRTVHVLTGRLGEEALAPLSLVEPLLMRVRSRPGHVELTIQRLSQAFLNRVPVSEVPLKSRVSFPSMGAKILMTL